MSDITESKRILAEEEELGPLDDVFETINDLERKYSDKTGMVKLMSLLQDTFLAETEKEEYAQYEKYYK